MKIIYVHEKYEYGKEELGLSSVYLNYFDALVKMNNGENQAIFFPFDIKLKEKSKDELNKELRELIIKEKPNIVFFGVGTSVIDKDLIQDTSKKYGARTMTWAFDDHWGFYKYSRHSAYLFDWIFTTDPLAIKKYQKIGYNNAVFMPQGYNHFFFKPAQLPKIYDVTFVGRPHGDRREVIRRLQAEGINVVCFGDGWPKGYASNEDVVKIFSQSKINLNFSESSGVLWKEFASIFFRRRFDRKIMINSPLKWVDNFQVLLAQKRKQLKGRMFKVVGCGGFFLTNQTEGLGDLYEIGKEIVCFSDFKDLVKKIKYYLSHEEERESIARAGLERSLEDHTCEKRFNEIFNIINSKK